MSLELEYSLFKRGGVKMDINECISFTSQTISNLTKISDDKKKYYSDMLKNINRRKADPFLNVALIGDFSSGKSTFINALIKQNLLKTAWMATTAIPTHIYYHNKKDIAIYVDAADEVQYNMSFKNDRRELGKKFGKKLPEEPKELITMLTTTNEFADYINLIRVYCPTDESFKDVCIIDTPGVNPGANDTKSHVVATRNVLREYADATVVLFQAHNVYKNSFRQFLEENAKHFMDDAIFVITMMDVVDEDGRQDIIDFVKQCLKDSFGLNNPMVFGCCAKHVNENSLDKEEQIWCDKFDELRNTIITYINDRREFIIKKQISVLLKQLIEVLDEDIQENISRITQELDVLKQNSIENLKDELNENKLAYTKKINDSLDLTDFDSAYNGLFSNIISIATRGINSCTKIRGDSYSAISYYMSKSLPTVIEREQKDFSKRLDDKFNPIKEIIQEYTNKNKEVFQKYSINLSQAKSISVQGETSSYSGEIEKIAYDGGNLLTDVVELAGAVVLLPLAIVDDLLGTELAEIVGWALDGIIGGFINFFSDIDAKKREAISKVESSVKSARDNNKSKFKDQLNSRKKAMIDALDDISKKFSDEYKKIYTDRHNAFISEKEIMENEINNNKQTHKKFAEYLEQLE